MAAMANGPGSTGMQVATVTGGGSAVPTLLGRSAMRIPVGGRIRAGIKVLTRRAEEVPVARAIYAEGVAAGRGFESIEREIAQRCPELKNPLTPKNVPYFTVRGEDFPNPELAGQILQQYGEERGDGVRRLYRFPVVFPADAWQHVMPHELVTWTASEKRYWSEYAQDGQTRYCKTHEAVPVDASGRRAIRIFGGRKTVLRAENGGRCDPEACPEYQSRKCNLSGRFIFFIPGIRSISAFELPTNSFYAMQAAIERFQTIGFMRGGRISGFLDGRRTPFYITKRLVEVARIDDDGRPSRVAQWLIELEAPVDVTSLLRPDDDVEASEARASAAASLLEGRPSACAPAAPDEDLVADGAGIGAVELEPASERAPERPAVPAASPTEARSSAAPARTPALAPAEGRAQGGGHPAGAGNDVARILDAAAALGVDNDRFEAYAQKRWGKGWKLAAGGRKRALDEVDGFAGDAEGFQAKVGGELDIFS